MREKIDLDLISRYDRPGPRYTSYPTAPLFSTEIGAGALQEALMADHLSLNPLSLYVHIPFCHKLCWYCGCNMKVSRKENEMEQHLGRIRLEIERMRGFFHPDRQARQIHFGGGTPNYLEPAQLIDMVSCLRKNYRFADDAEISVELDPRHLDEGRIQAIAQAGFNRVSMGVQDFQPQVQQAINRIQPYEMVRDRVASLRAVGLDKINMDLIYGLPFQTPETFRQTVAQTIELSPNRIALFNFAHVPNLKPHMKLIKEDSLPAPHQKMQILIETINSLTEAGYLYIGMDHFSKPDDSLTLAYQRGELHRNFQGYTTMAGLEMIGFGMSAISMLDRLYVQNLSEIPTYEQAIDYNRSPVWRGYALNDDDCLRREVINQLMCRFTIDPEHIETLCGQDFDSYFPSARDQLAEMTADGLLEQKQGVYHLTWVGRLLMRNVAMIFDRYLEGMMRERKVRFSRTV